jgi:thiol-disulfide isomerase/thioredoxin
MIMNQLFTTIIMGFLDLIFGNKKKEQERLRLEDARHQYVQQRINRIKKMAELVEDNHNSLEDNVVYLAIFSTSWCGPSKRFIKEINEAGISNYAYIDVDKEEDLVVKFSIRSVPTTLLIDKNDKVLKQWNGYDDEDPGQSKFVSFIKNYNGKIVPYKKGTSTAVSSSERNIQAKTAPNNIKKETIVEDDRTVFYELENIKYRSMGGELMLAPYDFNFYLEAPDAKILPTLTNTDRIRRFLPGLGFDDEESTKKSLKGYLLQTENQLGVAYFVRLKNIPIGLVHVETPLYNKKVIGKAIWTIDFYIAEQFENHGIMYNAVVRVLNEMKNAMGAKVVYALVDQDNIECVKFLEKGLFKRVSSDGFINSNGGLPPFVYMTDIEHMQFLKK